MKQEFNQLADEWESETMHMSSPRQREQHPAFQKILDFGPEIIPLAMERLKRHLGIDWSLVLEKLVDNPPDISVRGDMKELRRRWIEWEKHQSC